MTEPRGAGKLPDPSRVPFRSTAGHVLVAATAFGLLAGWGEVATQLVRRFGFGTLWLFGPDLVWMAPLAELALFLIAGLLYLMAALPIQALRRPPAIHGAFGGLAALALLIQADALHPAATAVLAAGLGSVLGRRTRPTAAPPVRTAAALAVAVVVAAAAVEGATRLAERRAEARTPAPPAGRPNVLLLVLDTVRAWNLGLYGHGRPTTPLLDRRAESAVIFNRAVAPSPWTLPSHASLFTGQWPFELSANWETPLDGAPRTLAEALGGAGYAAAGFVANYRYTGRSTGLARGFARYVDYPRSWDEGLRMSALVRRLLRRPAVQEWLGRNRVLEARPAAAVNGAFLRWLDRREEGRPFFAFLNYIDAHSPYLPPRPYDTLFSGAGDPRQYAERYLSAVEGAFGRGPLPRGLLREYLDGYDGALRYLDVQVDSLLAELDRRNLLANTVVVLTSDHGEHFGEHGLIQHGNSLYLPVLHVPLVIWAPGLRPGRRIATPVSLRDLAATVLDLAGVVDREIGGRSLARWWAPGGDSSGADLPVASVDWHRNLSRFPPAPLLQGSLRSLVFDSLHYIRRADGLEELYDPDRDFLESRNLASDPRYASALEEARRAADAVFGSRLGPVPPR